MHNDQLCSSGVPRRLRKEAKLILILKNSLNEHPLEVDAGTMCIFSGLGLSNAKYLVNLIFPLYH